VSWLLAFASDNDLDPASSEEYWNLLKDGWSVQQSWHTGETVFSWSWASGEKWNKLSESRGFWEPWWCVLWALRFAEDLACMVVQGHRHNPSTTAESFLERYYLE
jgi:hypothetical protein